VAQRVARAVETRRLAVPDTNDTVGALSADARSELAAEHGRRRKLLVQCGPMHHAVLGQQSAPAGELQVVARQGRPFVAGDEDRRVVSGTPVVADTVKQETHQRLHAGEVGGAVLAQIALVQREFAWLQAGGHATPSRQFV